MRPTETLTSEHRRIERVLDEACALSRAEILDKDAASKCIAFIRNFADKRHHGKEEDRLFPLLVQRGMPKEGGPIGCMIEEHNTGRALVRRAADALIRGADSEVREALLQFAALLREHIKKEDMILFRMADQIMTDEDQERLEKEFAEFDAAFDAATAV